MKKVDEIKLLKYKESRLKGNSKTQALIDTGVKPKTADAHCADYEVGKRGERELYEEFAREFKKENITPEKILAGLYKEAITAKSASDRINALSWLGKYQAMFTDKVKNEGGLQTQVIIIKPQEKENAANRIPVDSKAMEGV